MTNSEPVQYELSSDARNSTSEATSSGVPRRFTGRRSKNGADDSGGPSGGRITGVSTLPGWTGLTRIPPPPRSIAADLVRPVTPHFDAEYDATPGRPTMPPV